MIEKDLVERMVHDTEHSDWYIEEAGLGIDFELVEGCVREYEDDTMNDLHFVKAEGTYYQLRLPAGLAFAGVVIVLVLGVVVLFVVKVEKPKCWRWRAAMHRPDLLIVQSFAHNLAGFLILERRDSNFQRLITFLRDWTFVYELTEILKTL
jgi:hypothetical protein